MLDTVVFEECWRNIKVSAYTDLYAYDPEDGAVLFISLAGNEQAVKAISSAIIACKTFGIRREGQPEHLLNGHPASRYRIMSTKLAGGSLHQIVADSRFWRKLGFRVPPGDHSHRYATARSNLFAGSRSSCFPGDSRLGAMGM